MISFSAFVLLTLIIGIESFFQSSHQFRKLKFLNTLENESSSQLRERVTDLDDYMYKMLLKEMSKLSKNDVSIEISDSSADVGPNVKVIDNRSLVEKVLHLTRDCPVEVVHKKRVSFGNYVEPKKDGKSIIVRLASGTMVNIDVGQIISCWEYLSNERPPSTVTEWAQVASEAVNLLGTMPPRKSDLQDFWRQVSQRSALIPVDSLDLGVYIFQERRFRAWINPEMSTEDAGVKPLSASQRYAAALLLFHDDFHFKRRPTRFATEQDAANQMDIYTDDEYDSDDYADNIHNTLSGVAANEDDETGLPIVEGGYKVLDEGLVLFREGEVFARYYNESVEKLRRLEYKSSTELSLSNDMSHTSTGPDDCIAAATNEDDDDDEDEPFRAGCISRQLRALEMYAVSPEGLDPPPAVKHILKRLNQKFYPNRAASILRNIKYTSVGRPRSGMNSANTLYNMQMNSFSVTPWSPSELEAAQNVQEESERIRKQWLQIPPARVGKRGASGRMDYRANALEHPCICVDARAASFFDDAFSLSPETGEILVHVVDVCSVLRRHQVLQETARERISSTFTPSGPLHMLPPQALESLKLSSSSPNEVITAALSVDADSGRMLGYRVFPSVIGPVFPIDVDTADELLAGVGVDVRAGPGEEKSLRAGVSDQVIQDLLRTQRLVQNVMEKQPWVDLQFKNAIARKFDLDRKSGTYEQYFVDKTPANRMVNALLTLYSNVSYEFCQGKGIPTPLAWENRDKIESERVRRHATQPLRSWIAQLQQKQLRAALKMELPLTKSDCAVAVVHHNTKRKMISPLQSLGREQMLFESFEAHCAQLLSTGSKDVVVVAEGLGRGGAVRIKEFLIEGAVSVPVEKGVQVYVRVLKINPEHKNVILELV